MEEKRKSLRLKYNGNALIVVCDTTEQYMVTVNNLSPMGMGIIMEQGSPDLLGKDIIIVTETLIMYSLITRMEPREDGRLDVGIQAKRFTPEVLNYLFESIGGAELE